jgi:trehalose transport system substrate-binding protein
VDEYKTVAEKLKADAGGQGKVTLSLANAPNPDPLGITISEWIVSYGGDPLILNDSGSVQAFTFLQGLWREGVFAPESKQAKYDTEVNYLKGETAWFATNWTFTTGLLADSGILDKFEVYKGWSGPVRAAHAIGGDVLGIPKGVSGKEKEAAIELANFLASKPVQEILTAKNTWLSVRGDALGQVPEEQKTTFEAATAELADGWYRPNVVYWNDVELAMNDAVKRIIYGGEDPQTVLDEAHGKIADAAQSAGVDYPPASA